MLSAGVVAEMYNLPAGRLRITCDHASAGGITSMHLRNVATSFIINNCRSCPFHRVVDIDNIGYAILKEWEEAQAEIRDTRQQQEEKKARLQELVSGDLSEALQYEDITVQSILSLVALLDDDAHHSEAAKKLVQASEVAPEFFSDLAVEVICSHFVDPTHGQDCIDCIYRLCKWKKQVPRVAFGAAKTCLQRNRNADEACFLIGDAISHCPTLLDAELAKSVISVRKYHYGFIQSDYESYPGRTHALKEIGRANRELLVSALEGFLAINDKRARIIASSVIESVLDVLSDEVLRLANPLIDSLELDDDIFDEGSADHVACTVLAALYARYPAEIQVTIEKGYKRLSQEARAILFSVYRDIVWAARWKGSSDQQLNPLYAACVPKIIPFMLQVLGGLGYTREAKEPISEALSNIARNFPEHLIEHLDSLLGTLANLTHELTMLLENSEPEDYPSFLEKESNRLTQSRFVNSVTDAIKAISKLHPRMVFARISEIISELDSSKRHEARYKSELVDVYGELGTFHDLCPEVTPLLYKFLLDFDSAGVRGAAVEAVGRILRKHANSVPQPMIDMIGVYLTDTFVYVHKTAVRVVRLIPIDSIDAAYQNAMRLAGLFRIYDEEPYFQEEIIQSLIAVTRKFDSTEKTTDGEVPATQPHRTVGAERT